MKRKKEKDKKLMKFCPSCGSINIQWELPQTWSVWKCWDCGYVGAFVIEDSTMAVEIRKDYLKRTGEEKSQHKKRKRKDERRKK
jgi:DNA-directed RNA polymerase subunit M/transcription elongation factor TFIIS